MQSINKTKTIACLVLTAVTLSGCESPGPTRPSKLPASHETPLSSNATTNKATKKPDAPLTFSGKPSNKPENKPDSAVTAPVNDTPAPEKIQTKSELYPSVETSISTDAISNKQKAKGTGSYTLNFDDADLAEVAKTILSDSLGLNYVLSPEVKGKVTLQTTEALSKEELLPTLEMVLRMNNAALVKDGKIYHIEPAANALYTSDLTIGGNMAGYQTRVIPVRNVAAEEIAKILKPLVQEKTILQVDNARNILVISGTGEEVQRAMEMVATFDVNILKGRSFALFTLAHVDPETVIKELEAVFNDKSGEKDAGFFRFIPIERLNAILAISHQARYLADIESWVYRLDKANTASGGSVNVYKVQNVDAVELADTLNEIFNGTQKKSKDASVAPGEFATELSSSPSSMSDPSGTSGALGVSGTTGTGQTGQSGTTPTSTFSSGTESRRSSEGSTPTGDASVADVKDIRIIADEPNNSLVIVATPREYETILPVITQLDAMPLQVLIDATIVEVDLKNDLKYGVQWSFNNGNFLNILTQGDADVLKTLSSGYSLFYSGGSAKAVLHALAEKSTVNVIASPSLMVLNNQEAYINVGDKVPIATSQSTNTNSVNTSQNLVSPDTTSAIVSNNIQMLETGITLKIKPRVNAGGLVLMKIEQEANQAVATKTSTLNSPTIQQRKINSSIAVKNGETIVLGGLIREDKDNSRSGMPILSDIPYFGSLFGTTTDNKDRTELVILITPRVVGSEKNARDVTEEFKRKLTGVYQPAPKY